VKNHDFTPKNHILSNCGGMRENVWSISCEKITILRQKILYRGKEESFGLAHTSFSNSNCGDLQLNWLLFHHI
jgi:hypothetical protein